MNETSNTLSFDNTNRDEENYIVPPNISHIGEECFARHYIKSIKFPKTLKSIGMSAFFNCKYLTNVTIPDSVETIESSAFQYCNRLKSIKLPNNLNKISDNLLHGCFNLKRINIPDSVEFIEESAFENCSSLNKIKLPKNLKTIGASAFMYCKNLSTISIPEGISTMQAFVFMNCDKLKDIKLPQSLKFICESAFEECSSLKSINLPQDLRSLGRKAFYKSGLTEITLPESINDIEDYTFAGCKNLKEVSLPASLSYISKGMFSDCPSLKNFNLSNSIIAIHDFAFANSGLTEITIPNSVIEFGNSVFEKCKDLKIVNLPSSIHYIPVKTFKDCTNLVELKIPNSIQLISSHAFYNCEKLEKINIPKKVHQIGIGAFESCKSLKEISLPTEIDEISDFTFSHCTSLSKIEIPSNVNLIGHSVFLGCENLKEVSISENVDYIGKSAFCNCKNLQEIKLPKKLMIISNSMFEGCENLSNIEIPESVTHIDENAFKNCKSITNITLPNNIEGINKGAFSGCYSLKSINIPESVKKIDEFAFENCTSLNSLFIPNSVNSFKALSSLPTHKFRYLTKKENGYLISNTRENNSIDLNDGINLEFLGKTWEKKEILINEQKNPYIRKFYNTFLSELPLYDTEKFLDSHNYTFFKQLKNFDTGNFNFNTYKFLYNIGAFTKPIEDGEKKVDYAQKTIGFLLKKLESKNISIEQINVVFSDMNLLGFKREFTDFFLSKFDELINEEKKFPGFIAKCYNEFETVQETNTNNHGEQRQLKPTIQKFLQYFDNEKFENVTPETRHIASTISPYFSSQDDFDVAVQINNEFIEKNVPSRLTKTRVVDKNSPFSNIDKLADKSIKLQAETLGNLTSIANNEFTFEWLEKNDPTNLILGKLCSCCAHLEGVGYSIMHASIVHPNVQNLAIRNKFGKIIAKSTLYINPKEGYGVFNNVEVNSNIVSKPTLEETIACYDKIYEKYIEAVNRFANQYNLEHPESPLKQINVGGHLNDLGNQLVKYAKPSSKLLKAIDYSEFGTMGKSYSGDSSMEQYVIWKANETKKSKKTPSSEIQSKEI